MPTPSNPPQHCTSHAASLQAAPVTHYENFPVASILCPPALRRPIAALYGFARTADDLADEGDATAAKRLADLTEYRAELHRINDGLAPAQRWHTVFAPLQFTIQQHALPLQLLDDLISAFIQDVEMTAQGRTYRSRTELLDYCSRSANPVGRLLLHLYGVDDAASLERSDAICSALQLINFWQDLSVDLPRGRHYVTDEDCAQFGVRRSDLTLSQTTAASRALVLDCAAWARSLMQQGAPLVHALPGRIGWELRLVVQGGLCILDKVQALQGESLRQRPTVRSTDLPRMLWRAVRM